MELAEKIRPDHTALVVIDVQKDFADPDGLCGRRGRDLSQVEPMIEKLQKTISVAEKAGVSIYYIRQIFDRSKMSPMKLDQYDIDGNLITCDIATDGWNFYKLNPPEKLVYTKYNYNAFSIPEFVESLQKKEIRTLVFAGMDTYVCVETALRSGFDLGYRVVLPKDLVAANARHLDWHERTLAIVQKIYGPVIDSSEINHIWSSLA
ncbi:MAG: cysteine hydrolase [bacterium]|nr:cysteine hydrolase [bacterium]